jgi:ribosome recycling factor
MPVTDAINAIVSKMEEDMKERLQKLSKEFSVLRTGRANPMILDNVKVEYYGQNVPLKQVAAISIPEARVLEIRPWDPSILGDLEKAIQKADIGVLPQNDGKMLRLSLPTMTEDRRKDLMKVVRRIGEEFRVAVRSERHVALDGIRKAEKAKEISQDDVKSLETRIQKTTDAYIQKIDQQTDSKEQEISII